MRKDIATKAMGYLVNIRETVGGVAVEDLNEVLNNKNVVMANIAFVVLVMAVEHPLSALEATRSSQVDNSECKEKGNKKSMPINSDSR
jgi:hypothetical protein